MLTKRNGIYYFSQAIPKTLRKKFNRCEIKISLKTRNKIEAIKLGLIYAVQAQFNFDRAKESMEFPKGPFFNFERKSPTQLIKTALILVKSLKNRSSSYR